MDGTMIDNTPFHKKAWLEFCKKHGITLTEEEYHRKISGKRNDAILELLFGRKMAKKETELFEDEKEAIYRKIYGPHLQEVHGLKKILVRLQQAGLKIGVATTSPFKNRVFILETLELQDFFAVVAGPEHVKLGKPHPEIYFLAAEKMGVEPNQCLVFEDTPTGVKSAKSAGMTVVGVLTAHTKEELYQADYFIKDFSEIEI